MPAYPAIGTRSFLNKNDEIVLVNRKKMEILNILVTVFVVINALILKVACQSSSLQGEQSSSACHGAFSDKTTVNATCTYSHVIAIKSVTLGSKLESIGCPTNYNSSFNFSTCCTQDDQNDCTFPLYSENYNYHTQCDGKQTCKVQTQTQGTSCTTGTHTSLSRYMFMEFYCIEDDKIVEMCSTSTATLTEENTAVYIWNKDFSVASIDPSDTSCNCSVEIDNCDADINIYKMLRILTGNGAGTCNQTIRIGSGENSTILFEWTCDDNKQAIENYYVQATYILLNLENTRNESDGKVWMGFEATENSNITVSCPPISQQHCMPTTTSTTETTTTSVTTVTTSTTTENVTSTTTTESTSSSTTSSTMSTTSVHNETTNGEGDTENGDYLAAVIALSVLIGALFIVIIILSCCLYKRWRPKDVNDVEKQVAVVTKSFRDVGCQFPIEQVHNSDDTTEQSNTHKPDEIRIEWAEFGCQVNLAEESKIVNDLDLSEEKSTQTAVPPILEQKDKSVTTVPIILSQGQCQTDVIKKKNRKSQVDLKTKVNSKPASSQTDFIFKDNSNHENTMESSIIPDTTPIEQQQDVKNSTIVSDEKPIKPVANGSIPVFKDQDEAVQNESVNVISRGRYKKKKKKKRIIKSDDERYSLNRSPDNSDEPCSDRLGLESPLNQRFLATPETNRPETEIHETATDIDSDCNDDTDTEGPDMYSKAITPTQVRPVSPNTAEKNRVHKMRRIVVRSLFSEEMHNDKMIRNTKNRQSKKKQIKKRKNSHHSTC